MEKKKVWQLKKRKTKQKQLDTVGAYSLKTNQRKSNRKKLLTISVVFPSCGSNAAQGWPFLYQR